MIGAWLAAPLTAMIAMGPAETSPPPSPSPSPGAEPVAVTPATEETADVAAPTPGDDALPADAEGTTVVHSEPPVPADDPVPVAETVTDEPDVESESPDNGERLIVAQERSGPPFATEADDDELRARYGVTEPPAEHRKAARWRCLIADPTCGTTFEVAATAAYGLRFRQGDVTRRNSRRWSTGRAQYDFLVNVPVLVETRRKVKFTKMSLGPKGGLIFSDTGDFWGNLGIAARYWLGRGRFAPSIEFTSALSFKLGGRPTRNLAGAQPKFESQRGPVGFTADVGLGLGGFGALIIGGQYDSPLAREDIPEQFRVSAAGMFFVGFRGNILWGAPAGAAVLTHGLTQRLAQQPVR